MDCALKSCMPVAIFTLCFHRELRRMAVFKFYNVQLLPVEKGGKNVGAEGYC